LIASATEAQAAGMVAFFSELGGNWQGSYKLWLRPGTPVRTSAIRANIQPAAGDDYYLMTYSWKTDGEHQEGVFLFGGREQSATATWGDSWHVAPEPMHCEGELQDGGEKLVLNGSYSAGTGPDWGWRTEFTRRGNNTLLMEAYNITPDGEEGLAVKAEMRRVASSAE
jgi:hypothetical protein